MCVCPSASMIATRARDPMIPVTFMPAPGPDGAVAPGPAPGAANPGGMGRPTPGGGGSAGPGEARCGSLTASGENGSWRPRWPVPTNAASGSCGFAGAVVATGADGPDCPVDPGAADGPAPASAAGAGFPGAAAGAGPRADGWPAAGVV